MIIEIRNTDYKYKRSQRIQINGWVKANSAFEIDEASSAVSLKHIQILEPSYALQRNSTSCTDLLPFPIFF